MKRRIHFAVVCSQEEGSHWLFWMCGSRAEREAAVMSGPDQRKSCFEVLTFTAVFKKSEYNTAQNFRRSRYFLSLCPREHLVNCFYCAIYGDTFKHPTVSQWYHSFNVMWFQSSVTAMISGMSSGYKLGCLNCPLGPSVRSNKRMWVCGYMVYSFPQMRAQCVLFCLCFLGVCEKCEMHITRLRPFGGIWLSCTLLLGLSKNQTILINSKNYCGIRYSFSAIFSCASWHTTSQLLPSLTHE